MASVSEPFEPLLEQILAFCAEDPVERVFLEDVARRRLGRFTGFSDNGRLDALCHAPVDRTYYRSWTFFERIVGAAPMVGASLFYAPPSAVSTMHRYLDERLTPLMQALDGCLRRATYQNLDDPGRVLEALPVGLILCDPQGSVRSINAAAERMLAVRRGAVRGRSHG